MANPRKFSEKIALHNQKQAEETAEFERVMQECNVTRVMVIMLLLVFDQIIFFFELWVCSSY